jgi:SAM-dependent methyltransferase
MLSNSAVHDAAVIIRMQEDQEPEMVGFVTARADESIEQDEAANQVEGWGNHFETTTYAEIEDIGGSAIGSDFMGWTSMYDGSAINKAEMQEWLDDTIQALLDGQEPGRVLEIGTGTGMVLFNLAKSIGLESYVGLEPSRKATTFVTHAIKSSPALAGKADVHIGTAIDVGRLGNLRPDLVVLNSVVQYFPTPEYLVEVVSALARISGVKRLFFGDIRSYATNKQFLAARALHTLGGKATKDGMRKKMAELEGSEEEMLVDPTFFTTLTSQLPGQVEHVEILPKQMRATNELSAYRYAAMVHIRDPEGQAQPVHAIDPDAWVDFGASQMDRSALASLLQGSSGAIAIAVSNIPYSKTILERNVIQSLDEDSNDNTQRTLDGPAWVSAVRSSAERCASLSATDLTQLGKEAGFRVELSWARQRSYHGALDAVFHHYLPAQEGSRVLIQFPTDN